MPLVWFCNLTEFEALRQLPNTFILPPATSSVCAHSEVRIQIAQEILEVITNILSEPNQVTVNQKDSTRLDLELHVYNHMMRSERICPPRDLSTTCSSEIISFPRTRRSWPNQMRNLSNLYNHNSTTASWVSSLTGTTTKMSKKWIWMTDQFTSIWKRLSRLVTSWMMRVIYWLDILKTDFHSYVNRWDVFQGQDSRSSLGINEFDRKKNQKNFRVK